jgi:hypothetical protein
LSLDPSNANAWTGAVYVASGHGVLLDTKEEEEALRDGAFYAALEPSPAVERLTRHPSLGDVALSALVSETPFHATRPREDVFLSRAARILSSSRLF